MLAGRLTARSLLASAPLAPSLSAVPSRAFNAAAYTAGFDPERIRCELQSEHQRRGVHDQPVSHHDPHSRIVFYNMRFCQYAQRTALVLLAKKLDFQNINIFLREKPEWFLRLTPIGKVPIIIVGDQMHFESNITTEYLDDKFPEIPMRPSTPDGRARDKEMVELSKRVYGSFHTSLRSPSMAEYRDTMEEAYSGLALFEQEIKDRGTAFFLGDERPGILDYNVWPWFERIDAFHNRMDMDWSRFPEMKRWYDAMWKDEAVDFYKLPTEDHIAFVQGLVAGDAPYNLVHDREKAAAAV